MATTCSLIEKISDFLSARDKQTNFGECRRCNKKVYWSTSKVASHIRSGHCSGTSEEEVQLFKREFVYDSPKNLVRKSSATKKFKETFEIEEYCMIKSPKSFEKAPARQQHSRIVKKPKLEFDGQEDSLDFASEPEECNEILYEEMASGPDDEEVKGDGGIMFVGLPEEADELKMTKTTTALDSPVTSGPGREEKFIQAVYPQFKGKSKLQLIEHILDLKRRNDLLQSKAKTYENTINRLLN